MGSDRNTHSGKEVQDAADGGQGLVEEDVVARRECADVASYEVPSKGEHVRRFRLLPPVFSNIYPRNTHTDAHAHNATQHDTDETGPGRSDDMAASIYRCKE